MTPKQNPGGEITPRVEAKSPPVVEWKSPPPKSQSGGEITPIVLVGGGGEITPITILPLLRGSLPPALTASQNAGGPRSAASEPINTRNAAGWETVVGVVIGVLLIAVTLVVMLAGAWNFAR